MPLLRALGVSGDPTYTHSWKFFGRTRSPEAVYSGRYRATALPSLLDCASPALTIAMPASDTVRATIFKLIEVLRKLKSAASSRSMRTCQHIREGFVITTLRVRE